MLERYAVVRALSFVKVESYVRRVIDAPVEKNPIRAILGGIANTVGKAKQSAWT